MASILASLFSKAQFTVTKSGGAQVLSGIKVKRVEIQLASNVPRHRREDGKTISDVRIIEPAVIVAHIICPTIDDVESVLSVMNDRQNLYTIKSKGIVMNNMMAMQTSYNQNADMLSAAPIQITFKELLQQTASPAASAQAGDSDTQDQGIQIAAPSGNTVSSLFTTVSNNFSNAVSNVTGFFGG